MASELTVLVFICTLVIAHASTGDRSFTHHKCLRACHERSCEKMTEAQFSAQQPVMERILQWTCAEECDYQCMWKTVDAFQKDRSDVPQFHGKWPFARLWGIQEPASVLFSILNGLSNLYMLIRLRQLVPTKAPLYWFWHSYAAICIHAWLWSTIFHTRDRPFTEHMDYFCAVSLVTYSCFSLFVRVLGTRQLWRPALVGLAFLAFYVRHVYYLAFIRFDYGYNMKVNVIMGIMSTTGWVLWGIRVRHTQPYVLKLSLAVFDVVPTSASLCTRDDIARVISLVSRVSYPLKSYRKKPASFLNGMAALLLMNTLVLLEVLDFAPIAWVLDAHSLWHAGTVPLPFLWYSYVIDDCQYMLKKEVPPIGEKKD